MLDIGDKEIDLYPTVFSSLLKESRESSVGKNEGVKLPSHSPRGHATGKITTRHMKMLANYN